MRGVFGGTIKFLLWVAVIVFVIAAVARIFFVDMAVVGHNGMAPTLFAGDQVLLWRGAPAEMGDTMLCPNPAVPGEYVLGRVVGKAGMEVGTVRGQVKVSGTIARRHREGVISFEDTVLGRTDDMEYGIEIFGNTEHPYFHKDGKELSIHETEVEEGIFLLGDNRTQPQHDSRSFGEVDPETCVGQVFMRLKTGPIEIDLPHRPLQFVH